MSLNAELLSHIQSAEDAFFNRRKFLCKVCPSFDFWLHVGGRIYLTDVESLLVIGNICENPEFL